MIKCEFISQRCKLAVRTKKDNYTIIFFFDSVVETIFHSFEIHCYYSNIWSS